MKVTVVPSQITTVEDKIAGNLNITQLLLLSAPVFFSGINYVLLPPLMHSSIYKILIMILMTLLAGILAIRIKNKLVLDWLMVLTRFCLRPRRYYFNKNSLVQRQTYGALMTAERSRKADPKTIGRDSIYAANS